MATNSINGGFWIGGAVDGQSNKVLVIDYTIGMVISSCFLGINITNLSELFNPSLEGGNMGKQLHLLKMSNCWRLQIIPILPHFDDNMPHLVGIRVSPVAGMRTWGNECS